MLAKVRNNDPGQKNRMVETWQFFVSEITCIATSLVRHRFAIRL